ncbi:hypothetical protein Plhal703r1_c52g0157721 [Plasmopara halstedii]
MRPSYQSCVADEKGGDCLGRCHPYDSLDISGNDLLTSNDNSALSPHPRITLYSRYANTYSHHINDRGACRER